MQKFPVVQVRRTRHLDAQIAFCKVALARGKTLAVRGEVESASRNVWLVEDAAEAIRPILADVDDAEGLERYRMQLEQVVRAEWATAISLDPDGFGLMRARLAVA